MQKASAGLTAIGQAERHGTSDSCRRIRNHCTNTFGTTKDKEPCGALAVGAVSTQLLVLGGCSREGERERDLRSYVITGTRYGTKTPPGQQPTNPCAGDMTRSDLFPSMVSKVRRLVWFVRCYELSYCLCSLWWHPFWMRQVGSGRGWAVDLYGS